MEDKIYTVYKQTIPNGKIYIGITKQDVKTRWKNGHGYDNNRHFKRAINKYGWENIIHEVLFKNLTKEEACLMEKFYIQLYNSSNPKCGYNNSLGGEKGALHSENSKKKISEAQTGRKLSQSTKEKMSNAHKGIKKTKEHKKHISEGRKGIIFSEEHKQKIRDAQITRKVICLTTGEIFEDIKSATNKYSIAEGNITKNCKGKRKSAGKHPITGEKLIWEYYKEG